MGEKGSIWLPEAASTIAPEIDSLFHFVNWTSLIIFAGILAAMIYFVFKYRRKHADERTTPVLENKWVELSWIVIPTIMVLVLFNWAFKAFIKIQVAPPESYDIVVRGSKWLWQFEYPNGTIMTNEIHVPAGRPVRLQMSSEDVIHSFYVPEFRVKQDVLPNRYSYLWFEATSPGEYQVFCTEYCGTQHSGMLAKVVAHTPEEFDDWLQTGGGNYDDMPLPEYGALLYQQQVCNTCHSIDGSSKVGPSLKNLYGKTEVLADGSTVVVDDDYLRESIINPGAQIVQGYPNAMPPTYAGLSERQVSALIEFIKEQQ